MNKKVVKYHYIDTYNKNTLITIVLYTFKSCSHIVMLKSLSYLRDFFL